MKNINKTQIQELVNELNDVNNINCRVENLYGEVVVIVDNKEDLSEAKNFINEYSDVVVELPMTN